MDVPNGWEGRARAHAHTMDANDLGPENLGLECPRLLSIRYAGMSCVCARLSVGGYTVRRCCPIRGLGLFNVMAAAAAAAVKLS